MNAIAIMRISLLRIARDRTALFFMVLLPVLVILIIGASVRGFGTFRVGVVDLGAGNAGRQLTTALAPPGATVSSPYRTTALSWPASASPAPNSGL